MATGELGMKRWFHPFCWNVMLDHDDEDEDEFYDYDDDED